jgi:hypothetical protein
MDQPVQQRDDTVTIHGAAALAATYRAVLLGIRQHRQDGLPTHELQQVARALFRAHTAAMSPPRHELSNALDSSACCGCQDGELIGSAEASRLLAMGRRQTQRLAAHDANLLGRSSPL